MGADMAVHHLVGACLEKRKVGGPATARRRSELGNRGRLHDGQLSSPSCSGRRFANFQRQRGPAGPRIGGFCANAPFRHTARGTLVDQLDLFVAT